MAELLGYSGRKSPLQLDLPTHHLLKKNKDVVRKRELKNQLPVQVRCTILDAWGWCTGTTQRDGMGREEGGGFRMGNTCIPVADYVKFKNKIKFKIFKKKKKERQCQRMLNLLHNCTHLTH